MVDSGAARTSCYSNKKLLSHAVFGSSLRSPYRQLRRVASPRILRKGYGGRRAAGSRLYHRTELGIPSDASASNAAASLQIHDCVHKKSSAIRTAATHRSCYGVASSLLDS